MPYLSRRLACFIATRIARCRYPRFWRGWLLRGSLARRDRALRRPEERNRHMRKLIALRFALPVVVILTVVAIAIVAVAVVAHAHPGIAYQPPACC